MKLFSATVLVALLLRSSPAAANDVYWIDPTAKMVRGTLSPEGGAITVPAIKGVYAKLQYAPNEGCEKGPFFVSAIGEDGIAHLPFLDSIYRPTDLGWKPFYQLTIAFLTTSSCTVDYIEMRGFPILTIVDPNAPKNAIYFMDVVFSEGTVAHIALGPSNESDPTHVVFDFKDLPGWARTEGRLRLSLGALIRLVVARQIPGK